MLHMPRTYVLAILAFCGTLAAQPPPPGPAQPVPSQSLRLTLDDALTRARAQAPALYSAEIAAHVAHEDTVQAKAALLPSVNWENQFIYTQPNGTESGVFISNDGTHVYNSQAVVHGDLFAPSKRADYRRAQAAEALARAKTEVAARGLAAVVVQGFYALVSAQREVLNASQSRKEAQQFLDITQKQEAGGEVAHADAVKAEILAQQRARDVENAQLAFDQARLALGVLLFPDYGQEFTAADDLETAPALPGLDELRVKAAANNPDLRAAQAAVEMQTHESASARAARLPSLSVDYFYGINSNQLAIRDSEDFRRLGSSVSFQLEVPLWNWGANQSRVRQAEWNLVQARRDLTVTQRQLLASFNSFYREADTARMQMASLRHSLDLSTESLRLTMLGYQAGEVTALEVSDAQSTLAEARTAYDQGLVRYRTALANLQTLTGAF